MTAERGEESRGSTGGDPVLVGGDSGDLERIRDSMRSRGPDMPGYIQLLKSGRLLERVKSAEFLGEIGDERGVLPLISAIGDVSPTVRYVAAKSLGLIGDRRAVDPLIRLLQSGDKWVCIGAVHALGLIGDKKAIAAIMPLLGDSHHDLRAHTAWALGKLGAAEAKEALERLLSDPRDDVRIEAKIALENPAVSGQMPSVAAAGSPPSGKV